jgi:hypothetical protein
MKFTGFGATVVERARAKANGYVFVICSYSLPPNIHQPIFEIERVGRGSTVLIPRQRRCPAPIRHHLHPSTGSTIQAGRWHSLYEL